MSEESQVISTTADGEVVEGSTSRRHLFQMGAIGVAALAGGAVVDALSTTPAGAVNGGSMLIGEDNEATGLAVTGLLGSPFSVLMNSSTDQAIAAANLGGPGLVSTGTSGAYGIWGASDTGIGVIGASQDVTAAAPVANEGIGVVGHVSASPILSSGGIANNTYGVVGVGTVGVYGATNGATSAAGPGVWGVGVNSISGGLQGTNAAGPSLILQPVATNSIPGGFERAGSFVVLANGTLHFNHNATGYLPLTSTVLLPAPVRILDTRSGETDAVIHPGSPISAGGSLNVQITGSSQGIPSYALGVVGNITAVNALAHGFLTVWPQGATRPGASTINYPVSTSIANATTVGFGTTGEISIYANQQTDVIFDAVGYIV